MQARRLLSSRRLRLPKIDINVIRRLIARIVDLLETPVLARTGYLERELAVTHARFAVVYVTHLCRDDAFERKLLCIDRGDRAVDLYKVGRTLTATFLLALDRIDSGAIRDIRDTEMIPAYPLQR